MDYLLGRIYARGHNNIRVILSDETSYTDIAATAEVAFNDERKLQDGEWFCIDDFSAKDYFVDYAFFDNDTISYANIGKDEYDRIKFFIAIQQDFSVFHFQRVLTNSRIINKKGIRYINQHPEMIDIDNVLVVNSEPDATYLKNEDKLLFKDVSRIRPMFPGIEALFREATDEEVGNFLGLDVVNLTSGFDKSKVSVPNRRRISKAIAQYNSFNDEEKAILNQYMKDYCTDIYDSDNSKVNIGSDANLKNFIYAIDQRFYSTPIRNEKRVATSVEDL